MILRSGVLIILAGAAMLSGPPRASAQPGYPLTVLHNSRLLVEVRINGRRTTALLDSAAETTLVDPGFAQELKLVGTEQVIGHGSGADAFSAGLLKGVTIQTFGLTLRDQTVAVTDLADVGRRLLGRKLTVILGREIFDAARQEIDLEGRRITVMPSESQPKGERLELISEHGVETIPVLVEGVGPVRATFDLGNGSEVLIGSRLAHELHVLTDGRTVGSKQGGGLGGVTERQTVTLQTLEVAGWLFHDVPAVIDSQPSASDANVGISLLRHFRITTDFAQRAIWLQPRT